MVGQRKSPELILKQTQQEAIKASRGKLKIYLGAAPGVGKTHTMLYDALEKRADGLDVVVGIAESHGRKEIEEALKKFEVLDRKLVQYRGKSLYEFDLDAALKRNPALILIDEMAHTNLPGVRHAKRWQDIKECLDRGIDVNTTLNVQHIESLKDDVSQIIQAPIRETVPDTMIEMADTIELVDLPPEELLKRLRDGKVYFPEQAELAIEHFFRKGNLIALRELALRATAERVSSDVLLYRQHEGITKIWPIKEKILVCVGPKLDSLKLIRAAKRIASSLQAEWIAVYIATAQNQMSSTKRNTAIQNLRMAEQLGAITYILTGYDIVKTIMDFAREQNITQIMLNKHNGSWWKTWFKKNLADEILRHSGEIDVYIMHGSDKDTTPKETIKSLNVWKQYLIAAGIIALVTGVNLLIYPYIATSDIAIMYLFSLAGIALFARFDLSIIASTLTVFIYSLLFVAPYYSLNIKNSEKFFSLVVTLGISQILSYLIIIFKRQVKSAKILQKQTNALYALSRQLTNTRGVDSIVKFGAKYIAEIFNSNIMVLLYKHNQLIIQCSCPENQNLDSKETGIAQWVYEMGEPAGSGTDTLTYSKALYLPLIATENPVGVIRIEPQSSQELSPEQMDLLESCTHQLAMSIEVDKIYESTQRKELKIKTEEARISLLEAIANNLHSSLKNITADMYAVENNEQTGLAIALLTLEIEKLNKLNNNIMRIIELELPNYQLKKEPVVIKEIINLVLKNSANILQERVVHTQIAKDLPLVSVNKKLVQEVLFNLIDNATKFTAPGTPIHITVKNKQEEILISVEDEGQGVAPEEKIKLFDKFYRGKTVMAVGGLGLGLAICQKIINLHDGKIWVENLPGKGAAFRFTLPV